MKDVINSCLPTILQVENETDLVPSDRFCVLHGIPADFDAEEDLTLWDQWREAASEVTDLPDPEHTKVKIEANELMDEWLGGDAITDRLLRELDAIDWCLNMLREEGELIEG